MKNAVVLALFALFAFGCASTPVRATTAVAPPGHQAEAPPPAATPAAPAASSRLSMTIPEGWSQAPADRVPDGMVGMLVNPSLRALIMVFTLTNNTPPAAAVTMLAGQLTSSGSGWTASTVQTSPDGNTAWITVDSGSGVHGRLVARRLRPTPAFTLVLMGQWPASSDAGGTAGIDDLAASASIE